MRSMDALEINDLFQKDRFPKAGWKLLTIFLYSPCGLALAIIRLFMLFQAYLAATLLPEMSLIRRLVLRMISVVLGLVIQEENKPQFDKKASVIISNHVTLFDYIPLHLVTGCIAPSFPRHILPLRWGLTDMGIRQGREVFKEKIKEFLIKAESSLLIHPEEETTSGKVGLLKFSSWYGFALTSMQPVCIEVWRPPITEITPNVLESSPISDLFWFLFTPLTIFKIKYLPVITRTFGETDEQLMSRVETIIANGLGVRNTCFTAADKGEYQKRCIAELNRPVIITEAPSSSLDNNMMAMLVQEVLPHVPLDVIVNDLSKTKNVDLTISNILEGIVHYVPLASSTPVSPPRQNANETRTRPSTRVLSPLAASPVPVPAPSPEASSSFPKSAQDRMLSLADRKNNMINDARKRYLERRGLSSL